MKVIAHTASGYLIDVTEAEIAFLQALCTVDKRFKHPKAGDEIEISHIYRKILDFCNQKDFDTEIQHVENILSSYKVLNELNNKINKEDFKEIFYMSKRL